MNVVSGFGPTAGAAIASHMDIDKVTYSPICTKLFIFLPKHILYLHSTNTFPTIYNSCSCILCFFSELHTVYNLVSEYLIELFVVKFLRCQ